MEELAKLAKQKNPQWMQTMKEVFDSIRAMAPSGAPNTAGPNMGAGTQPDTTTVSDATAQFESEYPNLAAMMKNENIQPPVDGIQQVIQKLDSLKTMVKKQSDRISSLENGVDLPSSGVPEQVNKGQGEADGEVDWPLDLNREPEE